MLHELVRMPRDPLMHVRRRVEHGQAVGAAQAGAGRRSVTAGGCSHRAAGGQRRLLCAAAAADRADAGEGRPGEEAGPGLGP